MPRSSITGADRAPTTPAGRDTASLGPSDLSDTGSDARAHLRDSEGRQKLDDLDTPPDGGETAFEEALDADSDSTGTGERLGAVSDETLLDAPDIAPDRIVRLGPGGTSDVSDEDLDADVGSAQGWMVEDDGESRTASADENAAQAAADAADDIEELDDLEEGDARRRTRERPAP